MGNSVDEKPDDVDLPDDKEWRELTSKQRHYYKTRDLEKRQNRRKKDWIWEHKHAHGCSNCDEDHPACLDFHHTNPDEKRFRVSQYGRYSLDLVKEEIEKCILLCANCHRKEHARNSDDYTPDY